MNKASRTKIAKCLETLAEQTEKIVNLREGLVAAATDAAPLTQAHLDMLAGVAGSLDDMYSEVNDLASEEDAKYEGLSEAAQGGTKGEAFAAARDALQEASESLQGASSSIGSEFDLDTTCSDAVEALEALETDLNDNVKDKLETATE